MDTVITWPLPNVVHIPLLLSPLRSSIFLARVLNNASASKIQSEDTWQDSGAAWIAAGNSPEMKMFWPYVRCRMVTVTF